MKLFPDGFTEAEVLTRRGGSLSFATREEPPVFWIVAQGYISPSLIREELPIVEKFGKQHAGGWTYVVDTTRVRLMHPLNPLLLRAVRRLPHNRRYVIIAPFFIRILGRAVSWLIRPTHIVSHAGEALLVTGGRLVSNPGKE